MHSLGRYMRSQVSQGYGRGLRELVSRYSPNTPSPAGFPVILGRDGTGVYTVYLLPLPKMKDFKCTMMSSLYIMPTYNLGHDAIISQLIIS